MTKGPIHLDVAVNYAAPRAGVPAAVSFRKWVAAALKGLADEGKLPLKKVAEAIKKHKCQRLVQKKVTNGHF